MIWEGRYRVEASLLGIPCEVEFDYHPGRPEIPPSFSHGGLPADPPELDIIQFYDRKGYKAQWLENKYRSLNHEQMQGFEEQLIDKASEYMT